MSTQTHVIIVKALKEKPMTVRQLIRRTGCSKSVVAYHLRKLKPRLMITKAVGIDGQPIKWSAYVYQIKEPK